MYDFLQQTHYNLKRGQAQQYQQDECKFLHKFIHSFFRQQKKPFLMFENRPTTKFTLASNLKCD